MNSFEVRAHDAISRHGPLQAFQKLIADNDALIRGADLSNGRRIAMERTAIYTSLVREWASKEHQKFGYRKPFAVVALGGTGRGEMAPRSDNDFAFLFEDAVEGNPFLIKLQDQLINSDDFLNNYGFICSALPFSLDDIPALADKQLNSFLDMRAVFDPDNLVPKFRERMQKTIDPFEHFMHVRGFWKDRWEKSANDCDRLEGFDIKNDAMRVFLAGAWSLAGRRFVHTSEIYETEVGQRDLDAYYFLLRIRAWVHSRRPVPERRQTGMNHPEDILTLDDFASFGDMLGPTASPRERFEFALEGRAQLLAARRRVASFAKTIIHQELLRGRRVTSVPGVVFGTDGVRHEGVADPRDKRARSSAALSVLLASQRHNLPVDPAELQSTFHDAGDWLMRVPELSALFYERRGSLAATLSFLSQIEGSMDRLFPGYGRFEVSIDTRVSLGKSYSRAAIVRQKLQALEEHLNRARQLGKMDGLERKRNESPQRANIDREAGLLDEDHLAGVRLALKIKRLPLVIQNLSFNQNGDFKEANASGFSGIPIEDYFQRFHAEAGFPREATRVAEFVIRNRKAFKQRAETSLNDNQQVEEFISLCGGDEQKLRALFVFTCADRATWENEDSHAHRWFNMHELYLKCSARLRPGRDPSAVLRSAGFTSEQKDLLGDFGEDFFTGVYGEYAARFGAHLADLADPTLNKGPKAGIIREGRSAIIGVAARDYRGLAASITGAFWHRGVELRQAHLFSAANIGLVLDFFHVAPSDKHLTPELQRFVEEVIREKRFIADEDETGLPPIEGRSTISEWRPGKYCLQFETDGEVGAVIYALTYKVFRYLKGNIFAMTAYTTSDKKTFVSIYHTLPEEIRLPEANQILFEKF